jgi:hypothetical protein
MYEYNKCNGVGDIDNFDTDILIRFSSGFSIDPDNMLCFTWKTKTK